ncbi:signal peptidase II [Metamycoplasma neophronis]|uniref:Lipoprotein signal peptidase n=1 Tax=Metamycoplasma neophronis TaxID=872983 RepID=A0ABY2Z487_9BACT|nr:signal peptidase II [Metamycoplasma neophronis]TPR53687.1 signal peptidase II [Metamycoplasma neophronis]
MSKKTIKRPEFFTKEYWKNNWKIILINLAIYLSVFIAGSLIDLLTKKYIYHTGYQGSSPEYVVYSSGFIRFWSVFHAGTTIELGLGNVGLHIISILIMAGTLFITLFFKDKGYRWTIAALALVSAGSFGNMYDRFAFGGVRDIINLPWANYGTFNFADMWLVLGAIAALLSIIILVLISSIRNKKNKANEIDEDEAKTIESVSFDSENKTNTVINNQSQTIDDPNHNF